MLSLLIGILMVQEDPSSFARVHEIFAKHCIGCHNAKEAKGELVLENHAGLMKGGEGGAVVVPGKSGESRLVKQIEHAEKPFMPPPKKGDKLKPEQIARIRAWIDAGAKPGEILAASIPRIEPRVAPRRAIHSAAYEPKAKLIALGRHGEVELRSVESRAVVKRLAGHSGSVNDLVFSADGALLAAASGEPSVFGEVLLWNVSDGKLLRTFKGHKDAAYAVALSPDGKLLASGGYDRRIVLWDAATGAELRALEGHNECVFDLAFRPDGKILASVSADRTLKLWDVAAGERRDTLGESTKALHAVAFSPDGRHVAAGGADNRIRVWQVGAEAREGSNAIRHSQFAHEGAILRLVWSKDGKTVVSSADDKTVKLSNAADFAPLRVLEKQPDWPAGLAFALDDKAVLVGRLDGTFALYAAADGAVMPPPKPESSMIEPRGFRSGAAAKLKVSGKNLAGLTAVNVHPPKFAARLEEERSDVAWVHVDVPESVPSGTYEISLAGPGGETGRLKVYVEALAQIAEVEPNDDPVSATAGAGGSSFWGVLGVRGDADHFSFDAKAGRTIVLDIAAKRIGSKADLSVTLADASGRVLASNVDFEGDADPLIAVQVPVDGRYVARVTDLEAGASADHFYRLSVGELPLVTGVYPLAVAANVETRVSLAGFNLPPGASVVVKAGAGGEARVPVEHRSRRDFNVLVVATPEPLEVEPNDTPERATRIGAPGAANGRIGVPGDADLYRFDAKAGRTWVIETVAAQRGSPVDTRIEVLHGDGRPVERALLRAVRDSYVTFRRFDANAGSCRLVNWEEMDLNQHLYLQGEVVKLFRAPRGPDSEYDFYARGGKRISYFDTTSVAHALDEPCYIVEPHPPGTNLPPNGLPSFMLYYANDDEATRKLGTDSRLYFTAPADGAYLVRVRDTRGQGGDRCAYRLVVREARPDFRVTLDSMNPSVPAGGGVGFTVSVDRIDGFDGPVRVDIAGVPPGFTVSTPLVIEAGHFEAKGSLFAAADAPKPVAEAKLTATAEVGGSKIVKEAGSFGKIALGMKSKVRVSLEPAEIVLVPGGEVEALLKVERSGFNERLQFDVDNLPHGVIVSDIGLNGVLIPEKQTERKIFLHCAAWVEPGTRLCHARAKEAGNPASRPVLIRVPARR